MDEAALTWSKHRQIAPRRRPQPVDSVPEDAGRWRARRYGEVENAIVKRQNEPYPCQRANDLRQREPAAKVLRKPTTNDDLLGS